MEFNWFYCEFGTIGMRKESQILNKVLRLKVRSMPTQLSVLYTLYLWGEKGFMS